MCFTLFVWIRNTTRHGVLEAQRKRINQQDEFLQYTTNTAAPHPWSNPKLNTFQQMKYRCTQCKQDSQKLNKTERKFRNSVCFCYFFPPSKKQKCAFIWVRKQISCVTLFKFKCALLLVRVLRCSYKQIFRTRPSDRARTEWTATRGGLSEPKQKSKGTFTTHWHDDGFSNVCGERKKEKGSCSINGEWSTRHTTGVWLLETNEEEKGEKVEAKAWLRGNAGITSTTTTTTTTNNYATTSTR